MGHALNGFRHFLFGLLVTIAQPAIAQWSSQQMSETTSYIKECSEDWASSVVSGDTSRMQVYFAEDFVGTGVDGSRYRKADAVASNGPSTVYQSNTIDTVDVRVFGTTAIAHGSETWVKYDGSRGQWIWTDIWLFRSEQWQLIAAQDVEIPISP